MRPDETHHSAPSASCDRRAVRQDQRHTALDPSASPGYAYVKDYRSRLGQDSYLIALAGDKCVGMLPEKTKHSSNPNPNPNRERDPGFALIVATTFMSPKAPRDGGLTLARTFALILILALALPLPVPLGASRWRIEDCDITGGVYIEEQASSPNPNPNPNPNCDVDDSIVPVTGFLPQPSLTEM